MPYESIRSFAKLFTNLTPGQQREFERALSELEDSGEISSLESSLDLLRRKPDQFLPIPQLTATPTVRGGIIEWEPLPDQRINIYEVDISETSNFASFNTISTFGSYSVIDGLTSSRFIRVRGVRGDGTTGPYSEIVQLTPRLFDLNVHTEEDFYISITGGAANVVIGGIGTDLDYVPINPDGQSMVWGFVSTYVDPEIALRGSDIFKYEVIVETIGTNGTTIESTATPWSMTSMEFFDSQSIGPFTVDHPELNKGLRIRLEVTDGAGNSLSEVFWAHLNALELGIQP